jgi:branched-chain amino acid transport system permease protein
MGKKEIFPIYCVIKFGYYLMIKKIRNIKITPGLTLRIIVGFLVTIYLGWRILQTAFGEGTYGPDTWLRFLITGLVIGGIYALIAIGYTLVYGILFMINFAHGEVMMLGTFAGYFVLELFAAIPMLGGMETNLSFLNAYPVIALVITFLVGSGVSALLGYFLEKIAYRPLRGAPRLIPLISAIGASIFLQNAAQLLFGPQRRQYLNPDLLWRGTGWLIPVGDKSVMLTYTGVFSFILSILLMLGLFILVKKTRLGKSMRAVAENKQAAALMGIDVDSVISKTFVISGFLAGAAGVMWGIHNGLFNHYVGFIPGIKAFTAAVLGGIGNIPGAMMGGMLLGLLESMGPAILGIDFQLKDVIAFTILILVLIFRPSGLLGEALTEEKL